MSVNVPISIGELVDKYTILLIKNQNIVEEQKLEHVRYEMELLKPILETLNVNIDDVNELKHCNEIIWKIEDDVREKERLNEFDDIFIQLARNVYKTNDERSYIKRKINVKYMSTIHEVKSHKEY